MTKTWKTVLLTGVVGLLVSGGAGLRASWEYLQAARAEASRTIERNIPLSLEIGRLRQLVGQFDDRIATDRRTLAEAELSLAEAKTDLQTRRSEQQVCLEKLRSLRTGGTRAAMTSTGCGRSRVVEPAAALRTWYTQYERAETALSARQTALESQQTSLDQLASRLEESTQERNLLVQRIAALESRSSAQDLGRALSAEGDDVLARAREIADRVERRLKVDERIDELAQPATRSTADSDQEIERRVDALLGTTQPASGA
jgi:hypothetical protein